VYLRNKLEQAQDDFGKEITATINAEAISHAVDPEHHLWPAWPAATLNEHSTIALSTGRTHNKSLSLWISN
jgi:hypothetical protein